MSVEEARRRITKATWDLATLHDAIDNFQLEMQAAVPCYLFPNNPPRDENIAVTCLCRSCKARAALKVPA